MRATFFFISLALFVAGAAGLAACGPASSCTNCVGCCNASGQCEGGTSTLACGTSGLTCSACGTGQQCLAGACITPSGTGGGSGGGTGSGGGGASGVVYLTTPDGGQGVSLASGDSCAGFSQLFGEYQSAVGVCSSQAVSSRFLSEAQCRLHLPICTTADRQQIDVMMNCFRRLEPCTLQTQGSWSSRADVCKSLASGLSNACQNEFR